MGMCMCMGGGQAPGMIGPPRDQAPLWLQEGVAKREEIRWRPAGPFDDRPPPDAIVQRGFEINLGLPLDRLGPSIAMLPSADAAMVAFAEVTSFVRYYARSQGDEALTKLMKELGYHKGYKLYDKESYLPEKLKKKKYLK